MEIEAGSGNLTIILQLLKVRSTSIVAFMFARAMVLELNILVQLLSMMEYARKKLSQKLLLIIVRIMPFSALGPLMPSIKRNPKFFLVTVSGGQGKFLYCFLFNF